MERFLSFYRRIIFVIGVVLKWLGLLLLALIVGCIFLQVVSRYFFGKPHVWVEEFATYCFIWVVFIGAAYALIKKRHIVVTTLIDFLPKNVRKILDFVVLAGMLFFLFNACRYGFRQFIIETPQSTIALPIRLSRHWFYSFPFDISMVSMFITTVYNLLEKIHSWKNKE
jgi:TRAP-type C4-dicarboxylate transport system permease small subunit